MLIVELKHSTCCIGLIYLLLYLSFKTLAIFVSAVVYLDNDNRNVYTTSKLSVFHNLSKCRGFSQRGVDVQTGSYLVT